MSTSPVLHGENAFYNAPSYLETTCAALDQDSPLHPTHIYNSTKTQDKVESIAVQLFALMLIPLYATYTFLQSFAGRIIIQSTLKTPSSLSDHFIQNQTRWSYKRFTIQADGNDIDAILVGKPSTLGNGRWMLVSLGNNETYEETLEKNCFYPLMTSLETNAIFFNYPCVGSSQGTPTKHAAVSAYSGALDYIEKKLDPKEIIGYGYSLGGGIQAEALSTHTFSEDIAYSFVYDRTFADFVSLVTAITLKILGWLIDALNWNLQTFQKIKSIPYPQIILQCSHSPYQPLTKENIVENDGIFPANETLAHQLLANKKKQNKQFIGVTEYHTSPLYDVTAIGTAIKNSFP